jgi:hypothetical protein
MPNNTYINQQPIGFEIVSDEPRFTSNAPVPAFQLTESPLYINSSEVLSFELRSYDDTMPVFAIILDFITETGGVYW